MIGYVWTAVYVAVVCALSAAVTEQWMPRGWFPGGEEPEPAPAPQPEQAARVPSWARQEAN